MGEQVVGSAEQRVRAAVPDCFRLTYRGNVWASKEHRSAWLRTWGVLAQDAEGYLGEDWQEALNHPVVVAFESQHRHASPTEDHGDPSTWSDENFSARGGVFQPKITDHYFNPPFADLPACGDCGLFEADHLPSPAGKPDSEQLEATTEEVVAVRKAGK